MTGARHDPDAGVGLPDRLRGAGLRAAGRVRPRCRDPVRRRTARRGPRRDGEQRRTRVGRQRNLAGARRRRPVRDVPPRLRGDPAGAVSGDHRDAPGAGVPRRRLRIPLSRRHRARARVVGPGVLRRLHAGGLLPGHGPRRPAAGHPRGGSRLCRRLVGLAHRFHRPVRHRGRRRLRAARCVLADLAHRRACCSIAAGSTHACWRSPHSGSSLS